MSSAKTTVALLACCLISNIVRADPPPSMEEARYLVLQLGSDSYLERELAQRTLLELGALAVFEVRRGLDTLDPEIHRRCERILALLTRTEEDIRLSRFLTGHLDTLPGWDEFRKICGDDIEARCFFIALHKANGDLFHQTFRVIGPPAPRDRLLSDACALQWRWMNEFLPAETLGRLFVAVATSDQYWQESLHSIMDARAKKGWRDYLRGNLPAQKLIRASVEDWLKSSSETQSITLERAASLVERLDLKNLQSEVIDPAIRNAARRLARDDDINELANVAILARRMGKHELVGPFLSVRLRQAFRDWPD